MSASTPLVWYHSASEGSARLVLLAIADHDGEGGAWPSVGTLARMTGLSQSTVRRAIKALDDLGEVTIHEQQGGTLKTPDHLRPNRYEIHLACPDWCDGTARHACRACGGKGEHRTECAACEPDAPASELSTGVSPVTPPPLSTGVSPVTPPPLSLVTPEPPIEPPITPPSPPEAPTVPESVARLWTGEGISEEDQRALWAEVIDDPETTVPAARARQRAWFVPALARIHAKSARDRGAALVNLRRFGDPCEHDEPGGADLHPTTGLPLCPLCRAKALS